MLDVFRYSCHIDENVEENKKNKKRKQTKDDESMRRKNARMRRIIMNECICIITVYKKKDSINMPSKLKMSIGKNKIISFRSKIIAHHCKINTETKFIFCNK